MTATLMTRDEARQEIKSRLRCTDLLERSKSGLYNCPFCGSGTRSGTGALKVYEESNTWYCHACHKTGDSIDLYMERNGLQFPAALAELADSYGIHFEGGQRKKDPASYRTTAEKDFGSINSRQEQKNRQTPTQAPTKQPQDFTGYYAECTARITDPAAVSYLTGRGISPGTAIAYGWGYDPEADPAQAGHPAPRIIIPTSPAHYVGRAIAEDVPKQFQKMNSKGSSPGIFNVETLWDGVAAIFVTEGAFDAISILEVGENAIALNSAANAAQLIKMLEERRTSSTLILALDNDERGQAAVDTLRQGLQRLNISYITADICGGCKDPNEALCKNRAAFQEAIATAMHQTAAKPDNVAGYLDALFIRDVESFKSDKRTGFANLDKCSGGLYAGLYVIAAISSLGKTTFIHQITDQLAEAGNDVLYFSLEQSRLEMVSKSIARVVAQGNMETTVTSMSIRKGYITQEVREAIGEYRRKVADRVSIIEGNFTANLSFIGDYIRQYIQRTGTRPVVVIDYLQILQPETDGKGRQQTTKEVVDTTTTELKRLSREMGLTIFAVSSVNRANYLAPIDFESLKESGSIEYTADVVWGLQLQCLNDSLFDGTAPNIKARRERVREAKSAVPRKIELVCLKNRYGRLFESCYFDYFPQHDLFMPSNEAELDFTATTKKAAGRRL